MQDFEKDEFIKNILQQDKEMSYKAENVFKNFRNKPKEEPVRTAHYWLRGLLTVAASFAVIAVSAGTAIYINKDKINGANTPITTQSTKIATNGKIVSLTLQDGKTIDFDEDKCVQVINEAGEINNIYYIKDYCLYNMKLTDEEPTKIATGVADIWQEVGGQIIVRCESFGFVLHQVDSNIKMWDYDVSNSKIVDSQENEYMILNRKEDNSLTLELKKGTLNKLFGAETDFLENFVYNFYISVNVQTNYNGTFADAEVMHLGTTGIDSKVCVVYASKEGKECEIDLYKYMLNDTTGKFHINKDYRWTQYDTKVKRIKTIACEVYYDNGTIGSCDIQETELVDGRLFYNIIRRPTGGVNGTMKYPDGKDIPLRY